MLKSSKHKKHLLRTKFLSKPKRIINPVAIEPSLSLTDTSMTASETSQNLSTTSDPQITEEPQPSLPFFEESVLFEYKTKQYSKCIKTIERILKVTPKDQSSHYKILLAAANTMIGKKFKRSHNLLNEVLAKNPFDAYALYGKGVAYYFDGKFDESIRYFDRALDVCDDGMEQAKEMKIRAQVENKQVRVLLEKIKVEVGQKSDEEFEENEGKMLKFGEKNSVLDESEIGDLECKIEDSMPKTQKTPQNTNEKLENQAENGIESANSEDKPAISTNLDQNSSNLISTTQTDQSGQDITFDGNSSNSFNRNQSKLSKNMQEINKELNNSNENGSTEHKVTKTIPKKLESEDENSKVDDKLAKNNRRSLRSANGSSKPQITPKSSPKPQEPQPNKFSSESFKQISSKSVIVIESSSEDDSSDLRPTSSANSFAQVKFNKALDLYMIGQLERSLKYFQKSLKYEPDFEEADEMETKAQEFIELLDVVEINMAEKNYAAVVEICTDGLEIDEGNDAVNRKILFHRGLSYFHLGENEKSIKDYEEYERLGRKLEVIEDAK